MVASPGVDKRVFQAQRSWLPGAQVLERRCQAVPASPERRAVLLHPYVFLEARLQGGRHCPATIPSPRVWAGLWLLQPAEDRKAQPGGR